MQNRKQMRKIFFSLSAVAVIMVFLSSCQKEYETIAQLDDRNIAAYKSSSGATFIDDASGYSYRIVEQGTGSEVNNTDSVYYHYTFKKFDGTVLNETNDLMRPGTFLGYTDQFTIGTSAYSLKPIREVLGKLNRGGNAVLLLPSRLAFGKNGLSAYNIGSNESLIVELGLYTQAKRHEVDKYEINKFISNNNLTFAKDDNKIRYNVSVPGTGTEVISDFSKITVAYTGRYLDGSVFDSSTSYESLLENLILGWRKILPEKVKQGGKIRVIIPSHLAYGTKPLDFDIEIIKVVND